ncbi:unnamed protein product [Citrullus colocynthis]|uniref:Uncharacterized protein n=1 Tax=Citrullus colocynthis TaxID=252529 RepID=A0ABP0YJ26_9ROSI
MGSNSVIELIMRWLINTQTPPTKKFIRSKKKNHLFSLYGNLHELRLDLRRIPILFSPFSLHQPTPLTTTPTFLIRQQFPGIWRKR